MLGFEVVPRFCLPVIHFRFHVTAMNLSNFSHWFVLLALLLRVFLLGWWILGWPVHCGGSKFGSQAVLRL